ncbi:MAG: UPF0182 family protein, partial [Armatimonadota bacterium]|nr:UPF0182 family protein [Armatimonadota bacterium]
MLRRFLRWFFRFLLVAVISTKIVQWWTEMWWFDEVTRSSATGSFAPDYRSVYLIILTTRLTAFAVGALVFGGLLWLNARIAWRVVEKSGTLFGLNDVTDPAARLIPLEDHLQLDRYRLWIVGGGVAVVTVVASLFAAFHWMSWHCFLRGSDLGQPDPIFGRDLGFYLFRLPALNFVWSFVFGAGIIALLLVTAIYAYEDVFELGGNRARLSTPALRHLCILGAALLLWKALGYRLSAYNLLTTRNSFVFGPGYTDVHWRLPLLGVLAVVALAAAGLLIWWGWRGEARRAALAPAGYLLASWLLGSLVPRIVQATVAPNERALEAPFLQHHLAWTRLAYNLDHVQDLARPNPAPSDGKARGLQPDVLQATAEGLPAWSLEAARKAFDEFYGANNYQFSRPDVDRYIIGREVRPVIVAAREVAPPGVEDSTWSRRHLQRISGDGLVICDASRTDPQGKPLYYLSASGPPAGAENLRLRYPEIFFGELQPAPSLDFTEEPVATLPARSNPGNELNAARRAYPVYVVANTRQSAPAPRPHNRLPRG